MKTLFRIVFIMAVLYYGSNWYIHLTEKKIEESLPASAVQILKKGDFVGSDESHTSSGKVFVYDLGDTWLLRFDTFSVTNGPFLHVLLTKKDAPADAYDVSRLKGNSGNQNYTISKKVAVAEYDSVRIYSKLLRSEFAKVMLR